MYKYMRGIKEKQSTYQVCLQFKMLYFYESCIQGMSPNPALWQRQGEQQLPYY